MELADLAAKCVSLEKYRAETCCVIGKDSDSLLFMHVVRYLLIGV